MSMKLCVTAQNVDTFLKLKCVSVHTSQSPLDTMAESEDIHVNDLATIQVQFQLKESGESNVLICSIKATNHINAKDTKVKINVSCQDFDVPSYLEWICDNLWKEIGKKLNPNMMFENIDTDIIDINIYASKEDKSSYVMKLYNDVTFTDFKLSTDQGSVPVHRAYLAAHSDVFQAMLSREWKETIEGRIKIDGVTLKTLQHLKDYMYLQALPEDGLESLLLLASYYLIDGLTTKCASKLALTSEPKDWSRLLEFAAINKIPELMRALQMMVNPVMTIKENSQK